MNTTERKSVPRTVRVTLVKGRRPPGAWLSARMLQCRGGCIIQVGERRRQPVTAKSSPPRTQEVAFHSRACRAAAAHARNDEICAGSVSALVNRAAAATAENSCKAGRAVIPDTQIQQFAEELLGNRPVRAFCPPRLLPSDIAKMYRKISRRCSNSGALRIGALRRRTQARRHGSDVRLGSA